MSDPISNYKYVVISPVRNEGKYIEKVISSMLSQTIKPLEWIIVNDGSTDDTRDIVLKYTTLFEWIRLIDRKDCRSRKTGGKIVEIFYEGYEVLSSDKYDFIVKLDCDLSFGSTYFEIMFDLFEKDKTLGIASGICLEKRGNNFVEEKVAKYHVHGACKIYRKKCFKDIGGLIPVLGWDGIDEYKAAMMGWSTGNFRNTHFIHHRPTGTEGGLLRTRINNGKEFYIMGYHPVFMFIRSIFKIMERPYIIGSLLTMLSFINCYFNKKIKRIDDKDLITFIRRKQMRRLFHFWI